MRKGWTSDFLMNISKVTTGRRDANHATESGKYRFYTCAFNYLMCDTNSFSGECLVLPGNGVNVGEVFYYNGAFDAYQRTYVISDIKINSKFLHYHMLLHWKAIGTRKQYGAATNFIKIGNFKDYKIEYPPLPEQKRIVSIIDKAFAAINKAKANAEQNLNNAKELFESYLNSAFTKGSDWNELNLKDIAIEFSRGKSKHRPRGDKSLYNGDYPLIQTGDIAKSNHILQNFSQTYNEKGLAQSKLWPKGTICLGIVGANVAETAILDFDACFPDSVIGIIVDKSKADNEYVEYLLQSYKAYLKEKGKGTARDNINIGTFQNERFPFPELAKQKIIVEKINKLYSQTKNLEKVYQQKLVDLEELKKSILQKAFNGEL